MTGPRNDNGGISYGEYYSFGNTYTSEHADFDAIVGRAADLLCAWLKSDRHASAFNKLDAQVSDILGAPLDGIGLLLREIDIAFEACVTEAEHVWATRYDLDDGDFAHEQHLIRVSAAVNTHKNTPSYEAWIDPIYDPSTQLEAAQ